MTADDPRLATTYAEYVAICKKRGEAYLTKEAWGILPHGDYVGVGIAMEYMRANGGPCPQCARESVLLYNERGFGFWACPVCPRGETS